jgi:hypothetical protein
MIIKTLRIKSKYRIKSLVKYDLNDGKENSKPLESFVLLNNIHTVNTAKIHKYFLLNDRYRSNRKNGLCYYHEILSISPKDVKHVTDEMLEDLAKKYIEIRGAKEALVLAKAHIEKNHRHIHLLMSSTKYKSKESLRLDNKNFRRVRIEMEEYQKEIYPQLEHSIAYLDKEKRPRNQKQADQNERFQNEFQMSARLDGKQPTKKEILKERVSKILETTNSPREFLTRIKKESDFNLYEYRSKITGLLFENKKYRFTTIGISKGDLHKLREQHLKLKILEKNSLEQTDFLDRVF